MSLAPEVEAAIKTATRHALHDVLLSEEGQMLMEHVASAAALHAIQDFMLKLGMDTTTPQAILALQADMGHLRWWNAMVGSGLTKFIITIVGLLATGGWALLLLGAHSIFNTPK